MALQYTDFQSTNDYFYNGIPFIVEGQVVDTNDPDQMGRAKVWVPSLDGDNFDVEDLPWTEYASPFFGFTIDRGAGGIPTHETGHVAYGMWAIPKVGATVLVFFLNGNPHRRFYFASTLRLHRNRSLPAGRNKDFNNKLGPMGDAGDGNGNLTHLEPAYSNLRTQFKDKMDSSQAITRGGWERQVAQHNDNKDGLDGYAKTPIRGVDALDPQTYCWVTPGHHAVIMQDNPENARLRLKTAEGHQVIFDDANERIYISTAKGENWIEMDQDGHIHIYSNKSISMSATKNVNINAGGNISMRAGGVINILGEGGVLAESYSDVNISAKAGMFLTACSNIELYSDDVVKITGEGDVDVKSGGSIALTSSGSWNAKSNSVILMTAPIIHLNGPGARSASEADEASPAGQPGIIPDHEPWNRPNGAAGRGPNWKA